MPSLPAVAAEEQAMSWIAPANASEHGDTPMERVLGHRAPLLERYRRFYQALWRDGAVPRRLLELTRLRIAAIHDCEAEWLVRDAAVGLSDAELADLRRGVTDGFGGDERAALAVAELVPFAHHQITDADVEALSRRLGPAAAVALITALSFFDATCRLKLVFEVEVQPAKLDDPPLWRGALI
jgi:alkylhydroperoxidase family enzyme